jgi:hypothetical protein
VFDVPVSPVVGHGKLLVVVEIGGGEVMTGIVGTGPAVITGGNALIIGTAAAELTPRFPISVDPNGIPVRATPPDVMGDVDVGSDDEAILPEPEPHIPDNPEVSSIPEVVDVPDDVDIPDVAGVPVPIVNPPPS